MSISSLGEETVPLVLAQSQIWDAWSRTFLHTCCVAQMRKWPSSGFCFLQGCADVYLFIGRTNCIPCARAPANLRGGQKGNTCLRASCASRIRKWTSIVSVSCNRTYILRPLYSRNRKIGERKGDTWPRACCVSRIREFAKGLQADFGFCQLARAAAAADLSSVQTYCTRCGCGCGTTSFGEDKEDARSGLRIFATVLKRIRRRRRLFCLRCRWANF